MSLWKIIIQVRPRGKREWKSVLVSVRAGDKSEAERKAFDNVSERYEHGRILEISELKDDDEGF